MNRLYEERKKELPKIMQEIKRLQQKRKKYYDYIKKVEYRANK